MAKPLQKQIRFTGNVDIPFSHSEFSCRKVRYFCFLLLITATVTATFGSWRCHLFCIPLSNDIPYPILKWMVCNLKMDNGNSKWYTKYILYIYGIWTGQLHFSLFLFILSLTCQCTNWSRHYPMSILHVCNQIQIYQFHKKKQE